MVFRDRRRLRLQRSTFWGATTACPTKVELSGNVTYRMLVLGVPTISSTAPRAIQDLVSNCRVSGGGCWLTLWREKDRVCGPKAAKQSSLDCTFVRTAPGPEALFLPDMSLIPRQCLPISCGFSLALLQGEKTNPLLSRLARPIS